VTANDLSAAELAEEPRYAWVGWRHAAAALDAGTLTGGSGSDNRVLRIAASPVVITADTPMLKLGPVFGWPQ